MKTLAIIAAVAVVYVAYTKGWFEKLWNFVKKHVVK